MNQISSMWSSKLGNLNQNDSYGLIVILMAIISRIFVVSIAWSYGIFLVALKKTFPDAFFSELGWIAGLAQGLGSILAPVFILITNRLGLRATFLLGFVLCFLSLFTSSYVTSEHYLFLTYSIPYGIGSAILFVLGSLLTGIYFPPGNRHYVSASVAVGLGFPLGFLILNPLSDALLTYHDDWHYVQRIYAGVTFICMLVCCPLFTEKHASERSSALIRSSNDEDEKQFNSRIHSLEPEQVRYFVRFLWYMALFLLSSANNSVLIHMNGYFLSIGLSVAAASTAFFILGASDATYRIMLAAFGNHLVNNLTVCYILAAFIGFVLSILWSNQTSPGANIIYCILFGFCPASSMSLMYSVNSEITGVKEISKCYTLNVMVSGFGLIAGPILSGILLDNTRKDYEQVYSMASILYFMSFLCFGLMKYFLILNDKETIAATANNNQQSKSEYVEFENEYE